MFMNFELSVIIPEAINSEASFSSAVRAFEGDRETTVWICRFTRVLRSSLSVRSKPEDMSEELIVRKIRLVVLTWELEAVLH